MKCNIFKTILFILIISILFIPLIGCNIFSPIIGKWQDNQEQEIVEFTSGGNVIIESKGYIVTGSYELISDDILKVTFGSLAGDFISAFGMDTWKYTISGDTLIIQAGGTTSIFYRYGSTNITTINTSTSTSTTKNSSYKTTTVISTNINTPFTVRTLGISLSFGEIDSKYAIVVRLQSTNLATTYTNYDVTLYENGNYRDYSSFSTDNEIGFKTVYFPVTEEEAEYYNTNFQQLDLINIFTIEVKAKTEYFFTKNIFINTTETRF